MSETLVCSDVPLTSSTASIALRVKKAAALDIRECPRSRDELAEGLSDALGRPITVAQIDAITAESKTHRMPAEWVPAWVQLTGSRRLLDILCSDAGFAVADRQVMDLAEYGRNELERLRAEKRAAQLRARLEAGV